MESRSVGKIVPRFAMLCVATLPACAVVGRPADDPALDVARQSSFQAGVEALDRGEHAAAAQRLAPVAAICPVDPTGRRAVLLLAASELDPRNPAGRPDAAAQLAAFQLARSDDDTWEHALAAQLYTLALDYGADPIATDALPAARVIWEHYLNDDGTPLDSPLGVAADSAAAASPAEAERPSRPAGLRAVGSAARGPRCDVPRADDDLVLPSLTGAPVVVRAAAPVTRGAGASDDVRALNAEIDRLRAELAARDQELERIRRTLRP